MLFVIWYLIFSYRDISHLFWRFASMTVCLVRSSSELLQGCHVLWPPYLRVHTWTPTVLGVKTALVDNDDISLLTWENETFCQLVFKINMVAYGLSWVHTGNRPYCVLEPVSQNATVDIKILVYKCVTRFSTNFFAWKKTIFYLFFGDTKLSS